MEQIQQQLAPPGQGYSMQYLQHPQAIQMSLCGKTNQDLRTFSESHAQHICTTEHRLKESLVNQTNTLEALRQDLVSDREDAKQDLETIRENHDQRVLNTEERLKECLVNQTDTLEAFRSSEKCVEQELSSVRDTLNGLKEVVTTRLPAKEDRPEVVEERSATVSYAQIAEINYDPSDGAAVASEVDVHLQSQGTQTLQSIAGVAQACNDTDLETMSSNGKRVDDRAKALEKLAEIMSNGTR
ncbi:hypothetical protein KCU85_g1104, partial [Aureobasidium melanogenum]